MLTVLRSVKDLNTLRAEAQKQLAERAKKIEVKVHLGSCGIAGGAKTIQEAFIKEVSHHQLSDVAITEAACIGPCGREPIVTIVHPQKGRTVYAEITPQQVPTIVERHLIEGKAVSEWLLDVKSPEFSLQEIRVMANQDMDPRSIEEYIARDGYQALAKALTQMKPDEVIDEVSRAGLRGRGGAGFPTGTKWTFVRRAMGDEKFVVCNGDEGDPGAYMNRAVLEGNPHSILEGMAIGAYAIGNVRRGFAYVRAEYPLAIQTLNHAIDQARQHGLLGKNILGTDFEFDLTVFPGAGAFVCGEETALLASIEGKRGNPRQRPPFPANKGLLDKPTTLNNVETWSNIPKIIVKGADWFTSVGAEKSKGTKTFCLVGKINNTGLIEVPLGTPLGQIVFDIGGGIPDGREFKAVQIGGPSGGCIPIAHLNTSVDYEAVTALGAIMGSGGLIVMDENNCMVDTAKFFLQFTRDESCGKCTPCRAGIPKMLEILTKITQGKGTMGDLDILTELAEMVGSASLCGLGQTAPNPVLTTLRHFREEYEAHIIDKRCPAAVCQALFHAPCQHTCPAELDCPGYVSLIKEGKFIDAYKVIKQRLPFPMSVGRVCDHPCEVKCRRAQVDEAVSIRDLKRIAADYAYEHGVQYLPPVKPRKAERVAIVGAGPAGLTAAYELVREGYGVTVFEALPVAGGMMAVAIPEYRLPKRILNAEIEGVLKLGVELKLNTRVNDIGDLFKQGYQAVFVSCGAHKGDKVGIPNEDKQGVFDAIDFLKELNLGKKPQIGKKVAVVGGGNSAIDAARSTLRLGAEEVHILYRRERKDMPAIIEEIEAAEDEGIHIDCLTAPTKVLSANGKVSGLECIRMELKDFDTSGRRTPHPVAGSEYTIPVDTVIEAIGQRPDVSFLKDSEIKSGRGGTIIADPRTLATNRPGVFAGGDAVTGPKTVIWAVAAGQRAATSIKRYLQGKPLSQFIERNGYEPIEIPNTPPTEEEVKERHRLHPSHIDLRERKASFKEVLLPFTQGEASEEASRCLRCDLEVAGEE
ncbi:MAG: FAD-binding protein [Chloroflexi bacterium]|nr:FAD-binding protein [Chloroflexota bacterium]MBM4453118.1 FAD-binding protein [Chloroflexota bacterium]